MKLAVCLLAAPVAGLVAPAAPARTATVLNAEMSKALPFLTAPKGLKGYIGEEAGFDPVGFAEIMDIKWMREAEIKHGRVAMLATIGYTYPEMPWFAQAFPGDAQQAGGPDGQGRAGSGPTAASGVWSAARSQCLPTAGAAGQLGAVPSGARTSEHAMVALIRRSAAKAPSEKRELTTAGSIRAPRRLAPGGAGTGARVWFRFWFSSWWRVR